MRLIIVRHAETHANAEGRMQGHADYVLSREGRLQADRLRGRFHEEEFEPSHIFTSPLLRAFETAKIISRSWTIQIMPWDDLKEHNIGVLSGLTWREAVEKFPCVDMEKVRRGQLTGITGAESLAQRRARGERVIKSILSSHSEESSVLLVSHGGIIQHIIAALLGTDRVWAVPVSNTAVFDFRIDLEKWRRRGKRKDDTSAARIDRFNDVEHLRKR